MSQTLTSRALMSRTLMSQAEPAQGWRHRSLLPPLGSRPHWGVGAGGTELPTRSGKGHGGPAPHVWGVGDPTVRLGTPQRGERLPRGRGAASKRAQPTPGFAAALGLGAVLECPGTQRLEEPQWGHGRCHRGWRLLLVVLAVAESSPGCAGSSEVPQVVERIEEGEVLLAQMGAPRPCRRGAEAANGL